MPIFQEMRGISKEKIQKIDMKKNSRQTDNLIFAMLTFYTNTINV